MYSKLFKKHRPISPFYIKYIIFNWRTSADFTFLYKLYHSYLIHIRLMQEIGRFALLTSADLTLDIGRFGSTSADFIFAQQWGIKNRIFIYSDFRNKLISSDPRLILPNFILPNFICRILFAKQSHCRMIFWQMNILPNINLPNIFLPNTVFAEL